MRMSALIVAKTKIFRKLHGVFARTEEPRQCGQRGKGKFL